MNFEIDTDKIKIASSQEKVSQTIEGLLTLNGRIPAHTNEEVMSITEKQLESSDYDNKPSRGEEDGITEFQLDDDGRNEPVDSVQEVQIQDAPNEKGGHRPEMWDMDDEKVRGHRSVPLIWHEVYRIEDERKNKPMDKKLKS